MPSKFHWFWHWGQRARYLNPRKTNAMLDEDYVGKIKVLVHSCSPGTELHAMVNKSADKYRWALHFLGMEWFLWKKTNKQPSIKCNSICNKSIETKMDISSVHTPNNFPDNHLIQQKTTTIAYVCWFPNKKTKTWPVHLSNRLGTFPNGFCVPALSGKFAQIYNKLFG